MNYDFFTCCSVNKDIDSGFWLRAFRDADAVETVEGTAVFCVFDGCGGDISGGEMVVVEFVPGRACA